MSRKNLHANFYHGLAKQFANKRSIVTSYDKIDNLSDINVIRKAIIPITGEDRRMRPFNRILPKALLPIISYQPYPDSLYNNLLHEHEIVYPAIHTVIQQLFSMKSTIEKVGIVVSHNQVDLMRTYLSSITFCSETKEITFQDSPIIDETGTSGRMVYLNGKIELILQKNSYGLGGAVLAAKNFVGTSSFMVVLGDHVFSPGVVRQMLKNWTLLLKTSSLDENKNVHYSEISSSSPSAWSIAGESLVALTGSCVCEIHEVHNTGLLTIDDAELNSINSNEYLEGSGIEAPTPLSSALTPKIEHDTPYLVGDMAEKPSVDEAKRDFSISYDLLKHAMNRDTHYTDMRRFFNYAGIQDNSFGDAYVSATDKSAYLCHVGIDIFHSSIFQRLKHDRSIRNASQPIETRHDNYALDLRSTMKNLSQEGYLYTSIIKGRKYDLGTPSNYRRSLTDWYHDSFLNYPLKLSDSNEE